MSNRPISVVELERRRLARAASLSKDLEAITAWDLKNMVEFNASKTQYCTLSNKRCPSEHSEVMNNQALLGKSADIYSEPGSTSHHPTFSRCTKPSLRPSLEYCLHIWGAAAPTTLSILDAVQRRAILLIGNEELDHLHLQGSGFSHATTGRTDIEEEKTPFALNVRQGQSFVSPPGEICRVSENWSNIPIRR
nr:unnamed protein product [Callosobruchus chinensis]